MKKVLSLVLALAMVIAVLSGCGAPAASETPAASAAPQAPAKAEDPKASPEKRVLKFLCIYDEGKAELYEMLDKYQAEHPDVDLQVTAITSVADMTKQLTSMAVAGDLPDVFANDRMYTGEFVQMGVLEDITDRANAELPLDAFYAGPLDGCTIDGRLYGIPFVANNLAVYYNKDILTANGIAEPTDDWTWDDYREIALACADPKNDVYGTVMSGTADADGTFQFMPWLWMAGGDVLNPENTDGFKTALNFLVGLIDEGAMSSEISNWTQTDASNQFLAGKAAMFTGGTWHVSGFGKNITDFEWDVVPYPAYPETGKRASCLGGHGLYICKGGNVDDAWDLVKYLSSEEVENYWMPAQNYIPVRSDVAEASDYFMGEGAIKAFTESMAYANSRGGATNYLQIDTIIQSLLAEVYTGNSTVDDALAVAVADLQEELK